ncbi:MAG: proline racemase family protein, partial [Candidatus Limnocylindrales bacterium]
MRQPQQQPIIRNYPARDRRSAEIAYRSDAERAAGSAWFPVAHRWTEGWSGATLSVVFEYRGATASPLTADAPPVAAAVASRPPATAAQRHARSTMTAIDLHCAGEPLRLLRSGFPEVPIAPILERRRWVKENADLYRRRGRFGPPGPKETYGALLPPPSQPP